MSAGLLLGRLMIRDVLDLSLNALPKSGKFSSENGNTGPVPVAFNKRPAFLQQGTARVPVFFVFETWFNEGGVLS